MYLTAELKKKTGMKLKDLLINCKPIQIQGNEDVEITAVDIDSRKVGKGGLFVAMKGT